MSQVPYAFFLERGEPSRAVAAVSRAVFGATALLKRPADPKGMARLPMEATVKRVLTFATVFISATSIAGSAVAQPANADRGQRVFAACAPCHSLLPDKNMTGPSLADLWNRQAGKLPSFMRYSPALKSSGIIWNETSLDPWIGDPQAFIPENHMTFRGIKDARARADLIAFLKDATQPGRAPQMAQQQSGMMGMMGGGQAPNLKKLDAEDRVQAITHCGDTYKVSTADGKTRDFWERNLRFKTDVSEEGPQKGAPALVPAGMMGDRADVIFAAPEEIGRFIAEHC
jgi:cytochrome c